MRQIYTFILILGSITGTYSQQSSNPLIDQGMEIVIDRRPENDFFYTHIFEKGQTIYSLAKIFNTKVSIINSINALSAREPISVGQIVRVPLSTSLLYTKDSKEKLQSEDYIPVYYLAQPKETLYRIAKTYFAQNVATFAKRNKIKGTNIAINQKLHIGWLPIHGKPITLTSDIKPITHPTPKLQKSVAINNEIVTPESMVESDDIAVPTPITIKASIENASEEIPDSLTKILDPVIEEEIAVPTIKYRKTRGIGIWERDSKVNNMAVVLHHTAKKNSIIELYNPQLNLTTKAKVLGRIPLGTYPSDVIVIMSKKVAQSLGALDTRLMVDLKFIEITQ